MPGIPTISSSCHSIPSTSVEQTIRSNSRDWRNLNPRSAIERWEDVEEKANQKKKNKEKEKERNKKKKKELHANNDTNTRSLPTTAVRKSEEQYHIKRPRRLWSPVPSEGEIETTEKELDFNDLTPSNPSVTYELHLGCWERVITKKERDVKYGPPGWNLCPTSPTTVTYKQQLGWQERDVKDERGRPHKKDLVQWGAVSWMNDDNRLTATESLHNGKEEKNVQREVVVRRRPRNPLPIPSV